MIQTKNIQVNEKQNSRFFQIEIFYLWHARIVCDAISIILNSVLLLCIIVKYFLNLLMVLLQNIVKLIDVNEALLFLLSSSLILSIKIFKY